MFNPPICSAISRGSKQKNRSGAWAREGNVLIQDKRVCINFSCPTACKRLFSHCFYAIMEGHSLFQGSDRSRQNDELAFNFNRLRLYSSFIVFYPKNGSICVHRRRPRQRGNSCYLSERSTSLGLQGQDGASLRSSRSLRARPCAKPAPLRASTPTAILWAYPKSLFDLPKATRKHLTPVAERFRGSFFLLRQVSRCILGYQHAGTRYAVFYNWNFGFCVAHFRRNVVAYAPSAGRAKNDPSDCRVLWPRRE